MRRLGLYHHSGRTPDPLAYLERFGAFAGRHEEGLRHWALGHILQALWMEDFPRAADLAALLFAAEEQSGLDGGCWDAAWLLTLLEDPPPAILDRRPVRQGTQSMTSFSPLWNAEWTTITMAYVREMDLLATRRREMATPARLPGGAQQGPTGAGATAGAWAQGGTPPGGGGGAWTGQRGRRRQAAAAEAAAAGAEPSPAEPN